MNDTLHVLYTEDYEDDAILLELSISRYATGTPIKIQVAETISESIVLFDRHPFDAVLIDWNLPDGEGTDLAKYIRKKRKEIPIIFLSGALTDYHLREARQYAPKACLTKDYSEERINEIFDLIRYSH